MSEHYGSVVVSALRHQVYELFTHFNDFPKFMSFVKEVTYYDDQRSHWVVQLAGTHEWDAVNEDWIPDQQIGWRSISGIQNEGRVKFMSIAPDRTKVDVFISYTPPAGSLGRTVDRLGVDTHFDTILQRDLDNFARMVEQAPLGALDPMQSAYLFHSRSAVAQGATTPQQEEAMQHDPMMTRSAMQQRSQQLAHERQLKEQHEQQVQQRRQKEHNEIEAVRKSQEMALHQQEAVLRQEPTSQEALSREPDPVYDTLGGRNASMGRPPIGDQDSRSERFPHYQQDPMISRAPGKFGTDETTPVSNLHYDSPWRAALHPQNWKPEDDQDHSQGSEQNQ